MFRHSISVLIVLEIAKLISLKHCQLVILGQTEHLIGLLMCFTETELLYCQGTFGFLFVWKAHKTN